MSKSKSKKAQIGKKVGLGFMETVIHVGVYILVIFLFIKAATLAYDFSYQVFGDPAMSKYNQETVRIDVPEGTTVKEVAKTLEDNGLIKYKSAFVLRMKLAKLSDSIQPGTYDLSQTMTADDIVLALTTKGSAVSSGTGSTSGESSNESESQDSTEGETPDGAQSEAPAQ